LNRIPAMCLLAICAFAATPSFTPALEAHGFGLAWFEQKRAANGDISFVRHMVMDNFNTQNAGGVTFTEPHDSAVADVDGDGIPDFIVDGILDIVTATKRGLYIFWGEK
jgi:hypothetical protein